MARFMCAALLVTVACSSSTVKRLPVDGSAGDGSSGDGSSGDGPTGDGSASGGPDLASDASVNPPVDASVGPDDLSQPRVDQAAFDLAGSSATLSALNGKPATGSAGCGQATAATGMQSISLKVDGTTRTGLFVVPASYDDQKAYPIVFVFHGDGGTGASIRSGLNLETAAAGKAIFAYLDGAGKTWDATLNATNHDMNFVMALRAQLRTSYCIDVHRTFATGHSRGSFFVNQLACQYGIAEFAGMAPHSGTISAANNSDYVYGPANPKGGPYTTGGNYDFFCPVDGTLAKHSTPPILPPPMFIIHGECDTEGGVTFAEGEISVEHWGYAARCTSTPVVIVDPNTLVCDDNTNMNHNNTTCPTTPKDPCYKAPGCASGHDITFCAIPQMPHAVWCNAPTRIWAFFAAH